MTQTPAQAIAEARAAERKRELAAANWKGYWVGLAAGTVGSWVGFILGTWTVEAWQLGG